jgi:hypothetical protein
MKWYKHLVDSGDDPDIRDSMTLFGEAGYYIFFRTLEVLSREFDENNPGTSTFSLQYFSSRFYKTNWRTLSKVLQFFQDRDRFNIQFSENKHFKEITVKCVKLKDLCDEYTQKLIKQKSGQTPDSVGTNSRIEEEVRIKNKNKNKNKDIAKAEKKPSPEVKVFIDFYYQQFEKFFSTCPHIQGGKDGAITKRLLSKIELEELQNLLIKFFESSDKWILDSGYTIAAFESQINKLKIGPTSSHFGLQKWANEIKEEEDGRER